MEKDRIEMNNNALLQLFAFLTVSPCLVFWCLVFKVKWRFKLLMGVSQEILAPTGEKENKKMTKRAF